ncbi:Transmembrane domain-containing protein [Spironucleus salmonicida]|uniref:Transmembrane domain-containing protein n=1 Tax=Spironucleus salmonicida TaxID=348837 RepID=V6LJV9_9EUKA|nr:Transmembrane domain-containing protein [Spironucleus salmonicida]|eukprot:EST44890.1 Transmembrane domain-containing protein [Spironucleus salmonicida]
MSELKAICSELLGNYNMQKPVNKKLTAVILCQCVLCGISLLYCILTFYHQNFKGLICLVSSLAITAVTYITAKYRTTLLGMLFVITLVMFVFQHVMTRKWAYLVNDHDIVNDWSY